MINLNLKINQNRVIKILNLLVVKQFLIISIYNLKRIIEVFQNFIWIMKVNILFGNF